MADQKPVTKRASGTRGIELGDGLHSAFPTPFLVKRFGDADGTNTQLTKVILDRAEQAPSVGMSNVKGWHSEGDLLDWPEPGIKTLRDRIETGLSYMLEQTRNPAHSLDMRAKVRAWANVARQGAYNAIHNHTPALYSGVYYVAMGDRPVDDPASRSGLIEFVDPRPGAHGGPLPTHAFNKPLILDPEPGMMLIFPSWLLHAVHPYDGMAARISVAFNLHIKDNGISS
jgi:uncharacterized protein (TIGR02466 family)